MENKLEVFMLNPQIGLEEFLKAYPGISIVPSSDSSLKMTGSFSFAAQAFNQKVIEDAYDLEFNVPYQFPKDIPIVFEISSKIIRSNDFHVNPNGSLCLGSPVRLLDTISKDPTLSGFASSCLIPFLYSISFKSENGGDFLFGELPHGEDGILEDYIDLFELSDKEQARYALSLLSINSDEADKMVCPCGCGKRFSECQIHTKLSKFRSIAPTTWFRDQYEKRGASL